MIVESERLILKNYSSSDIENLIMLRSEPLVWRYSDKTVVKDISEVEQTLEIILSNYNNNKCEFQALFLKDTDEYIGEAGLLSYNPRCKRGVIGYNLHPKYWGFGYATEITKALVRYLYEYLMLERIEALTAECNHASRKVLEKSGFVQEGNLRNFAYIDNQFLNVILYGMIRQDYMNATNTSRI
ncbi:GNAT family N-acetyltransferase [Gorillibacterium massiliense]|uniref:GNAT family N-acetyltransferase n=1 Tax=Gorillibacterium massiliense TaxID=1280390 RepID=UPI00069449A7|nr:GNAT family N-acetyltransferase [Gorillibacterium massiliense]